MPIELVAGAHDRVSVPISIRRNRSAGAVLRVAARATLLIAAVVLAGCGAEDAPDPLCSRVGYFSVMRVEVRGFGASHGDEVPFLVDACPRFLECETFRIRPAVDDAERADCSLEPGTSTGQCELAPDDTLHLDFELAYPVSSLHDNLEVTVTLRKEDGTPFAENVGEASFEVQYGSGEECGQTHTIGRLELQAEGWLALP